ncbi:MAG: hypothetical protein KUG65_13215, partial [Sphingomonadaceae bacterium]|nr:hypothetical protein [Sphingomonadaceae bacterium]
MVAVLDPDAQSGIVEGYFAWSEEDSSAYLIAESGALPVNGTRVLTTLDDAQLSRMGSDWFQLAGQIVAIVEPVAPITVGTNGFEGQISGIFIAATKDVRLAAGSTFSRVVLPELALSLDFTSSLPAGETASGGENGTRINSSGLIEAATAPRYDHSIAGVPRGPILEGDRTNLRTNCRDFTGWLATNFTITGDDAAGPDGAVSADLATRTSTALANIATGHTKAASALAFAHSVSAKKSAGNYLATRSQNAAVFAGAVFDLTDDSIHYESGANTLTQIEAGPNGYSRASVSGVSDATTWLAINRQ